MVMKSTISIYSTFANLTLLLATVLLMWMYLPMQAEFLYAHWLAFSSLDPVAHWFRTGVMRSFCYFLLGWVYLFGCAMVSIAIGSLKKHFLKSRRAHRSPDRA